MKEKDSCVFCVRVFQVSLCVCVSLSSACTVCVCGKLLWGLRFWRSHTLNCCCCWLASASSVFWSTVNWKWNCPKNLLARLSDCGCVRWGVCVCEHRHYESKQSVRTSMHNELSWAEQQKLVLETETGSLHAGQKLPQKINTNRRIKVCNISSRA